MPYSVNERIQMKKYLLHIICFIFIGYFVQQDDTVIDALRQNVLDLRSSRLGSAGNSRLDLVDLQLDLRSSRLGSVGNSRLDLNLDPDLRNSLLCSPGKAWP